MSQDAALAAFMSALGEREAPLQSSAPPPSEAYACPASTSPVSDPATWQAGATSQKKRAAALEGAEKQAEATVAGAECGIAGNSLDAIIQNVDRRTAYTQLPSSEKSS